MWKTPNQGPRAILENYEDRNYREKIVWWGDEGLEVDIGQTDPEKDVPNRLAFSECDGEPLGFMQGVPESDLCI